MGRGRQHRSGHRFLFYAVKKLILFLVLAASSLGTIIPSARVIDWTNVGVVGGIPTRSTINGTLSTAGGNDSTDNRAAIQTLLNAATGTNQVVSIPPGIYRVNGALNMPSGVTLRGTNGVYFTTSTSSVAVGTGSKSFTIGASLGYVNGVAVRVWSKAEHGTYMQGLVTSYSGTTLTINVTSSAGNGTYADWRVSVSVLKSVGSTGSGLITFGAIVATSGTEGASWSGPTNYSTAITSGATSGSTSIVVASVANLSVGNKLVITETNNATTIITTGNGTAGWVDGWNTSGTRARGQIVDITAINSGTKTLTISPALYSGYVNTPLATYFYVQCHDSGVEDLMTFATNSGTAYNVYMGEAQNCWAKNVYCDFQDANGGNGTHLMVEFGWHNEVRHCYFFDSYIHSSGNNDNCVCLRLKTSESLVIDNIAERLHLSFMAEWGAAGNVFAYNYSLGSYDNSAATSPRWLPVDYLANHGAHPQFNLYEGNIGQKFASDSYWGSSGPDTIVRNWFVGHGTCVGPFSARMEDYNAGSIYQVGAGVYYLGINYYATAVTIAGENPVSTPLKWAANGLITLNQDNSSIQLWQIQYNENVVGNILGDATKTAGGTFKITSQTSRNYGGNYIWNVNYQTSADTGSLTPLNTTTPTTYIDTCSYDYVNLAQTFDGSIADHAVPNSYFLSGKPTWFGNLPWPTFDPTAPSNASVSSIPAGYRYLNDVDPPAGDTTPPTPNPSTISGTPSHTTTTITVIATTSTDASSPPVAYNLSVNGNWQGWQASPTFVVIGLTPSTTYAVTVKAQDSVGNQTTASGSTNVTTDAVAAQTVGTLVRNPSGPL